MPPDREVGPLNYTWVELGKAQRLAEHVNNDADKSEGSPWANAAAARKEGRIVQVSGGAVMFSRECVNQNIGEDVRAAKKYEYFVLTRDPEVIEGEKQEVTGEGLTARSDQTANLELAVAFTLPGQMARRFADLTTKNKPEGRSGGFERPTRHRPGATSSSRPRTSKTPITGGTGIISRQLHPRKESTHGQHPHAGALPATLKPQPVSENTMGATLGADTIRSGAAIVLSPSPPSWSSCSSTTASPGWSPASPCWPTCC